SVVAGCPFIVQSARHHVPRNLQFAWHRSCSPRAARASRNLGSLHHKTFGGRRIDVFTRSSGSFPTTPRKMAGPGGSTRRGIATRRQDDRARAGAIADLEVVSAERGVCRSRAALT